jgi:DNA-binding transcriptional MocR family regulator
MVAIPDPPPRGARVEHVMGWIRERIAGRALASGARLPSLRRLSHLLGVSKSTVVEAFDRLAAEGAIAARPGSGFYVVGRPAPLSLAASGPQLDRAIDPVWIMRQSLEAVAGPKPGCGWLPADWLPVEGIRRALRGLARAAPPDLVEYGPPLGFAPLRGHLARRLGERGIEAAPEQILLTDSGSQAIDLVCRYLLEPGDAVLVDDPCYFNFQAVLRAHRARIVGVPYTPDGPDLAAFAAAATAHRPRLYITNATLHNPTGACLTAATAHRLLNLAEAHDLVVVEDDIFADFEPEPTPRLAAFDGLQRVIHIGSFSKTLSAAVRTGFIAARGDWIDGLVDLKLAVSFGNGEGSARLVHQLLTDGGYRRHVEGLRAKLAVAQGITAQRLAPLGIRPWILPRGGLFLWMALPEGLDSAVVARRALAEGVVLAPGNVFSVSRGAGSFLRFNVAQSAAPDLTEVLRAALREASIAPQQ